MRYTLGDPIESDSFIQMYYMLDNGVRNGAFCTPVAIHHIYDACEITGGNFFGGRFFGGEYTGGEFHTGIEVHAGEYTGGCFKGTGDFFGGEFTHMSHHNIHDHYLSESGVVMYG